VPDDLVFRTKPQIALDLVDRALANGVRVQAWTFDELYGRDSAFLDGLEQRGQIFVAEVPTNFHGWVIRPRVLQDRPSPQRGRGRKKKYPRLAAGRSSSEVQNLLRYSVENCFRQAKEELGLDHYEVRGWRCVHRHFYLTQLSHLFCARVRQKFDAAIVHEDPLEQLTTEQVRRAINTWLQAAAPRLSKTERLEKELAKQRYYQKRNVQARRSHTKTTKARLKALGIDADRIKSCLPPSSA
jgi:SRSO17 transposase